MDEQQDEHLTNNYKLLGIRLRDKAYITHTSSDEAMGVVEYFEKNGSQEEKLEAYYYLASVCRDLKDYPQAMDYFRRVAYSDTVEANRKTLRLIQNACSQLSLIYKLVMLPEEAFEMAKRGLSIANQMGGHNPVLLMDVASSIMEARNPLLAKDYMDEAFDMLSAKNGWARHPDITAELMMYYAMIDDADKMEICRKVLGLMDAKQLPHNYLNALFYYYQRHNLTDSMLYVQKRIAASSNSWAGKTNSSRWLTQYFMGKHDMGNAVLYQNLWYAAMDSALEKRRVEQTALSSGQHRYSEIRELYHTAKLQAEEEKMRTWRLGSVFMAVLFVVSLVFYQRLRLHSRQLAKKNMELNAALERERMAQNVIEEKDETIKQKDNRQTKMLHRIIQLIHHTNQMSASADMKQLCADFEALSYGKQYPTPEDWNRLMAVVDNENPDFATMLHKKLKRIDDSILKTAYLLKIGMDNMHISNLMNAPRQTTWNRTKKLLSSLGDELTNT
ncbi:MAG: hypothetical protein SPI27_04060 [Bacteroidaceae bacterium]|nr:hypothetical protein [Bacteroidaceae bacterium]